MRFRRVCLAGGGSWAMLVHECAVGCKMGALGCLGGGVLWWSREQSKSFNRIKGQRKAAKGATNITLVCGDRGECVRSRELLEPSEVRFRDGRPVGVGSIARAGHSPNSRVALRCC